MKIVDQIRRFFLYRGRRRSAFLQNSSIENGEAAAKSSFRTLQVYQWIPSENYRNFGDELSTLVVEGILRDRGITSVSVEPTNKKRIEKLLSVGSVIHNARSGDVVWGSGVNGKSWISNLSQERGIDVRAVRGPLTQAALGKVGVKCPEIFGDPGSLFPSLFEKEIDAYEEMALERFGRVNVVFIPNLNDDRFFGERFMPLPKGVTLVSPCESPFLIAKVISQSSLVISSSLHGIVFADAYSVPCRVVLSAFEPIFKYLDYFEGTGRRRENFYFDVEDALSGQDIGPAKIDLHAIAEAFPMDFCTPSMSQRY